MSGLETAIRNALARSERGDADVRARIYQSARQALQAGLQKQDITDPAVIDTQRRRLEDRIREIEIEERQRVADSRAAEEAAAQRVETTAPLLDEAATTAPAFGTPDGGELGGQTRTAPSAAPSQFSAADTEGSLGSVGAEPAVDRLAAGAPPPKAGKVKTSLWSKRKAKKQTAAASAAASAAPSVPGEKRRRRRRGWISTLFINFTVLAFLALAAWWAYTSGLFLSAADRDTSVPNPPPQVEEEDFTGGTGAGFNPQQGFSSDWLEVYTAGGKAAVTPGSDASAETVAMADGPALRITSRAPGASGDVAITVPPEILRELAGKTSTIALTLQAVGDAAVQVAVRCDFSSLGVCSRHRVMAMQERADSLFRIAFDRTLAPSQPGRIYVNSDVLGGSQPILLNSIRILPGQ